MAAARYPDLPARQRTYRLPPATICGHIIETFSIDIQHIQRLSSDIAEMVPSCFTSAKSRTRRSRRWQYVAYRAHDEQLPARRHHHLKPHKACAATDDILQIRHL